MSKSKQKTYCVPTLEFFDLSTPPPPSRARTPFVLRIIKLLRDACRYFGILTGAIFWNSCRSLTSFSTSPCLFQREQVTGSQTLKLVHDRFKGKAPANVLQELTADMASAAKGNREISKHLGMAMEDLSALRVRVAASLLDCL